MLNHLEKLLNFFFSKMFYLSPFLLGCILLTTFALS